MKKLILYVYGVKENLIGILVIKNRSFFVRPLILFLQQLVISCKPGIQVKDGLDKAEEHQADNMKLRYVNIVLCCVFLATGLAGPWFEPGSNLR